MSLGSWVLAALLSTSVVLGQGTTPGPTAFPTAPPTPVKFQWVAKDTECLATCAAGVGAAQGFWKVSCINSAEPQKEVDSSLCSTKYSPKPVPGKCVKTCSTSPPQPVVVAYNGGAVVSFNPTDTFTGGFNKVYNVTSFVVFSTPDQVYKGISREAALLDPKVYIPGLRNGVSYSFQVYTVAPDGYRSEASLASNEVIPNEKRDCYGGCDGGSCFMGKCVCMSGFTGEDCSRAPKFLELTTIPDPPPAQVDVGDNTKTEHTFTWRIQNGNNQTMKATVLLYSEALCPKTRTECLPLEYLPTVSLLGQPTIISKFTYSQVYQKWGVGRYYLRAWVNPRVYDDTPVIELTFNTDVQCTGVQCLSGTCKFGTCMCGLLEYVNKDNKCTALDECDKKGLFCGAHGTCENGACQCDPESGYTGDQCQYGPTYNTDGCSLNCQHGTRPDNDGRTCGKDRCECPTPTQQSFWGAWSGRECETCGLRCANGGWTNSDCTKCECPDWFTGPYCEEHYAKFTFWLKGLVSSEVLAVDPVTDETKAIDKALLMASILPFSAKGSVSYQFAVAERDYARQRQPKERLLDVLADDIRADFADSSDLFAWDYPTLTLDGDSIKVEVKLLERKSWVNLIDQLKRPHSELRSTWTGQFIDSTTYKFESSRHGFSSMSINAASSPVATSVFAMLATIIVGVLLTF